MEKPEPFVRPAKVQPSDAQADEAQPGEEPPALAPETDADPMPDVDDETEATE